jgi:hypothetical protein
MLFNKEFGERNMRKRLLSILTMGITLSLITTGCAVKSAMDQPDKKDTSVFDRGTPRFEVIGEIGQPVDIQKNDDGTITDTYSFIQGYSKGAKAGRAFGHTLMDISTFGLWEIIGSPTEAIASGDKVIVRVKYDKAKLVDYIQAIKGKDEL